MTSVARYHTDHNPFLHPPTKTPSPMPILSTNLETEEISLKGDEMPLSANLSLSSESSYIPMSFPISNLKSRFRLRSRVKSLILQSRAISRMSSKINTRLDQMRLGHSIEELPNVNGFQAIPHDYFIFWIWDILLFAEYIHFLVYLAYL